MDRPKNEQAVGDAPKRRSLHLIISADMDTKIQGATLARATERLRDKVRVRVTETSTVLHLLRLGLEVREAHERGERIGASALLSRVTVAEKVAEETEPKPPVKTQGRR